jgi:hypothetical protein
MVFPNVTSNQSAIEFLDVAIRFGKWLGQETENALEATRTMIRESKKPVASREIDFYLNSILESELPANELKMIKDHLPVIFDVITPLVEMRIGVGTGTGFPAYGDVLQKIIRKIYKALHGWACFTGFQIKQFGEPERIAKTTVTLEQEPVIKKGKPGESDEKLVIKTRIDLIIAYNTSKIFKNINPQVSSSIRYDHQVYFGLGEANHFFYIFDSAHPVESWKVFFSGHKMSFTPVNFEKGGAVESSETGLILQSVANDQTSNPLQEKKGEPKTEKKIPEEIILTGKQFLDLSNALIADLLFYSKFIREERLSLIPQPAQKIVNETAAHEKMFNHWRKFFYFSEGYFKRVGEETDVLQSFIGVSLATLVTALGFLISFLVKKPTWLENYFAAHQIETPVSTLILFLILVCFIAILPAGFYLFNAMVYLSAGFFGGKGEYKQLSYLSSLLVFPLSCIQFLGLIFLPFGVIGLFLGFCVLLFSLSYGIYLYSIVVRVIFRFTSNKAWVAVLIPFSITFVFLASSLMLGILIVP